MKPLRLTLQALGPYAGHQIIDFRSALDSGLFGIYGSTGSGKSTIFSAMTFALFGEATNKDQVANSLRSDHADPGLMTEVELVFELGGKQYRIVRWPEQVRPSKRGGGETEEKHKAWLFDVTGMALAAISDANPGKVLAEGKVSLVDAKVTELLGYGATQFRQIILLPQGKFETFLTAKTEDRLKILRDLFDVSLYRRLADKLKEDARAAVVLISTARAVCDGRLLAEGFDGRDALSSGIESAIARHADLTKAASAAKAKLDAEETSFQTAAKTDAAFAEHLAAMQVARDLDSQREPVASLTVRRAGARIAQSLIDVDAAASVARQKAEQSMRLHGEAGTAHRTAAAARAKAAEKLKALDAKKSDVEALRARRRDYQSHSSKLAESLSLRTILGEADDRARTASEALRKAREHHAALVDQLRRDTAALAAAREAESGRASLARRSIDAEAAFKAAQAFETAASLLDTARDELIRAERAHLEAKHARDHAANTCRVADAALLHDHAQVLAGKLVPGAACPVCGSHDHPAPARDAPENAARSDVHEQAKAAFDAATVAEAGAGKRAGIAQALTREREAQLTALTQPERSARASLDVLTALKAEIDGFGAPADLVALAAANQSLDARIATANTAFDQARTHASTCETTLALARQSLDDALKAVPPNLRQPDALQVAAKLLDDEIASYDAATADAERAARQTRDALVAAERDADHADRNRKDAEAHLVSAEAALSARLAQHGLTPDSYAAHKLDIPRIDEFDRNIKDYATRRVVVDERARMAAAVIKDVVRPDIKLIETARDAADAAHTEATMQAITAGEHVKRLSDVQASIATEIARLDKLERDTAPLRELADAFGGKTQTRVDLETFAITTMFEAVLDAANLRLGPMTRGRYTLVRESDGRGAARRGLGIGVEDTYTGRQRPTSTLSGGETFIAALALALGLSEIVESQRGNVRLDTIFIDEGFGSLDSDGDAGTLEQVLQTLQDLVGRSRAVGLISHVPLVQQAIPNGFWITKTAGGSRIETRD